MSAIFAAAAAVLTFNLTWRTKVLNDDWVSELETITTVMCENANGRLTKITLPFLGSKL